MSKLAIITGASTGIGAAAAELFLQQGFEVVNVSRRVHENAKVCNIACDLSDDSAIEVLTHELLSKMSQAKEVALVHNAGYLGNDSAAEPDFEILERSLAVNVWAPTRINAQLIPHLPKGSSVLYVGSTLSEKAVANSYSYVASKHAVAGMMKSTCQDLFDKGVHSACICPGFTDTSMLREHVPDEDVLQQIGANNAFGRLAEPAELAELIVWAHHNPIINGSMLHGNLGQKEY